MPQLPYTTEVEAFDRLKRQIAAYRVVFGQPRQEELVTLLDRAGVDVARLRGWAVDLSPPVTGRLRRNCECCGELRSDSRIAPRFAVSYCIVEV